MLFASMPLPTTSPRFDLNIVKRVANVSELRTTIMWAPREAEEVTLDNFIAAAHPVPGRAHLSDLK
jgi:hypothetical protein